MLYVKQQLSEHSDCATVLSVWHFYSNRQQQQQRTPNNIWKTSETVMETKWNTDDALFHGVTKPADLRDNAPAIARRLIKPLPVTRTPLVAPLALTLPALAKILRCCAFASPFFKHNKTKIIFKCYNQLLFFTKQILCIITCCSHNNNLRSKDWRAAFFKKNTYIF